MKKNTSQHKEIKRFEKKKNKYESKIYLKEQRIEMLTKKFAIELVEITNMKAKNVFNFCSYLYAKYPPRMPYKL